MTNFKGNQIVLKLKLLNRVSVVVVIRGNVVIVVKARQVLFEELMLYWR